ncbi:MAG: diaminopimelate epimerase, partial [Saprospiraceae bacterium]
MHFWKYQGAGNDFVMVDQRVRQDLSRQDTARIARLCDRRFGVGADGLILLQNQADYDFEMIYFNADGRESSLCGNGGRCIAAFARDLGLVQDQCSFLAIDGPHEARIKPAKDAAAYWVELKMMDVPDLEQSDADTYILNTGSPHYVHFVETVEGLDMVAAGRVVRYSERFREQGINVNLVEPTPTGLRIRTYERGVEDETLACGTGVTAAALAFAQRNPTFSAGEIGVHALGGNLSVRF